jgi:hypothetical protein
MSNIHDEFIDLLKYQISARNDQVPELDSKEIDQLVLADVREIQPYEAEPFSFFTWFFSYQKLPEKVNPLKHGVQKLLVDFYDHYYDFP